MGIKPSLILSLDEISEDIKKILETKKKWVAIQEFDFSPRRICYTRAGMPITEVMESTKQICITNEKPLEAFDPRRFLYPLQQDPSISLSDATIYCFNEQYKQNAEQMLSYLLGFGPSWEAYNANAKLNFDPKNSIFTESHYEELGKIFSKDNPIEIGYLFHLKHLSFHIPHFQPQSNEIKKLLLNTSSSHIIDAVSSQTEYFQKSYTLKKWLLDSYFTKT